MSPCRWKISTQEFARLLKAPRTSATRRRSRSQRSHEPITLDPTLRLLALVALRDREARAWLLAENWRELLGNEPDAGLLVKILEAQLRSRRSAPRVTAFLATLDAAEEAAVVGVARGTSRRSIAMTHCARLLATNSSGARSGGGWTRCRPGCATRSCLGEQLQDCRKKSLICKNASPILRGLFPRPSERPTASLSRRGYSLLNHSGMPKSPRKSSPKSSKSAAKKAKPSPKRKLHKSAAKTKASTEEAAERKRPSVSFGETRARMQRHTAKTQRRPIGERRLRAAKASEALTPISVIDQPDVQEKLRDLIKLAKEQGYLTFDDLNEALPDNVNDPDEMETIMNRLRGMEIDIIDASEVDRYKDGEEGRRRGRGRGEAGEPKLDILDDPVRMYLKQMGQVPLLTREQEVEISKRIEDAEINVQKHINRFGFIAARLSRSRAEADRRPRAFRPRDPRQEDREPRALHEGAAEALCSNSETPRTKCVAAYKNYHGARRQEPRDEVLPRISRRRTTHSEDLPEVLLQAEGHRGIRASRRRDNIA